MKKDYFSSIIVKNIQRRFVFESLIFIDMILIAIFGLVFGIVFNEELGMLLRDKPWLMPTFLIVLFGVSYLIGWIINLKWILRDCKMYEEQVETSYDKRLLKFINIVSILYLIPLFIPIVVILRGSTLRILKGKVRPNTIAAFITEKYLNKMDWVER
ncbi:MULTISPECIES: hypothetical protein [Listeria]|uniref:hypothetical protein n=1 Tax=Listeria TaxID=1637 RepID=UPI000B58D01F|nr:MULTISPECIES: hypothetical protein [Listeria]